MFLKPFRVKTQTAIKGSDRKRLRSKVLDSYPAFPADEANKAIPSKDEMTITKLYTFGGESVIVYTVNKVPIFFEDKDEIYPTVYTLWKYPDMMRVYTTWPPVLKKLTNGADLMLPGFIIQGEINPKSYGDLPKGAPCAVNLISNKAPIAVGYTALSSSDMFDAGGHGKGVINLHTYGDHLWKLGDESDPPDLGVPFEINMNEYENCEKENTSSDSQVLEKEESASDNIVEGSIGEIEESNIEIPDVEKLDLATGDGENVADMDLEKEEEVMEDQLTQEEIQAQMDERLLRCFLHAVKKMVKNDIPLLTSKLFRTYMLSCLLPGENLDVKKSKYKKLSVFLDSMQKEGLIVLKQLSKGVDSVTEINREHDMIKYFHPPELPKKDDFSQDLDTYEPPEITEMFGVNGATQDLFKVLGFKKGHAFKGPELRKVVNSYVRENNLLSEDRPSHVVMDPILSQILLHRNENDLVVLKWDELFTRLTSKMAPMHQVTFSKRAPDLRKGKLEPINFAVAQRGGNKKVTLIENLETYGIDPSSFAHEIQLAIACSTSVNQLPGKGNRGQQVLIQGNQINFISNLLLDKYKLKRKYLSGLDQAKTKKTR